MPKETPIEPQMPAAIATENGETKRKISPLSLSGLKAIKEIERQQKPETFEPGEHPVEPFTQEELEEQWNSFGQILEQRGKKILLSYMTLSKPIKMGNNILLEFPNEGSKHDFENHYNELINHLKTNLRNFEIKIKITVIETFKPKVHYTSEEKFNHFKELNPLIEQFRNTFELDL